MIIQTKAFGDIEIQEEGIFTFNEGLPGFPEEKKFTVIYNNQNNNPFMWMQSVNNPEIALVIVDPFWFKPDYEFVIDSETLKQLEIDTYEDVLVFSVVVVPEDPSKATANLKAPIIINTRNKKAKQYVLDNDKYSVRHVIIDEMKSNAEKQTKKKSTSTKRTSTKKETAIKTTKTATKNSKAATKTASKKSRKTTKTATKNTKKVAKSS